MCDRKDLVLPNAWDAASAICIARAGASAIATTSAGIAWAAGVPDGGCLHPDQAIAALSNIVKATDLPVTADLENGYYPEDAGLNRLIDRVLDLGVAGINVEDSRAAQLLDAGTQAARIATVRRAADRTGAQLFINARIDAVLLGVGDPIEQALSRAARYVEAGADGIFVPGVTDLPTVTHLAENLSVPLNVMVTPGSPTTGELLKSGAGRVTIGMAGALAAYALIEDSAGELLTTGTYDALQPALDFSTFNSALAGRQ
ncbi:isocitrate lyase/phosphoenolpyruvate mutase family protein [Arthrobacter tecti]